MFLHHLRKTDKNFNFDPDEDIRGTSAIAGFYDTHYALRQRKDDQDYNELYIRSKDDEDKEFEVRWIFDRQQGLASMTMTKVDKGGGLEKMGSELMAEMMPGEGYTLARMGELLHLDPSGTQDVVEWLMEKGKVEKSGKHYKLTSSQEAENAAKAIEEGS